MLSDDVADEIARGRRGGRGVLNGHNAANCGTDGREATTQFRKKQADQAGQLLTFAA
jgi:hypothetical protein